MKKLVLSLAATLAATAFAPEASAVPAFARQTGMACSACHYQHFPLLNGFGRAFKNSGFTLMGAQGRIEGDNNLSIPDVVNMGVFTTAFFQTQGHEKVGGVDQGADPALGKWGVPGTGGELSLFIGGRVTEFAGFLAEAAFGGDPAGRKNVVGPAKLALLFPVGDYRLGTVIYSSPDQGAAYSFETLNTGAVGTHKMMGNTGPSDQHVQAAYAAQYLGTKTAATGINVVGNGDIGFFNIGAYEMAGNDAVSGANNLDLIYGRLAGTFDMLGWDTAVGVQYFGGKSYVTGTPGVPNAPKAAIVDFQMQGDAGTLPVGFYASFGKASAAGANETNPFNSHMEMVAGAATAVAGTQSKHSLNLAAEVGVIPHVVTVQLALRAGKNGAATNNGDNAVMVGVAYELAQNMAISFHHTQQSGSAWNANAAGDQLPGKDANTLLLETAF